MIALVDIMSCLNMRAGVAQLVEILGYGLDDWGSILGRGNGGIFFRHRI
jgi:hypothetical protein